MPKYEVQGPDGRTLEFEGATPPAESDIDAAFAHPSLRGLASAAPAIAPTTATPPPLTRALYGAIGKPYPPPANGAWDVAGPLGRAALPAAGGLVGGPAGAAVGEAIRGVGQQIAHEYDPSIPQLSPLEAAASPALQAAGQYLGEAVAPAARVVASSIGRNVGKAAEAISGLEYKTPGVLSDVYQDPSLLWAAGKKKVGEMFATIADPSKIRPEFSQAMNHGELLSGAMKALDDGTLTPEEALIARQTLDQAKNGIPRYSFNQMRDAFDSVAKTVSADADTAFTRAVKGDALRQPFPVNKGGGTSIFKGVLGKAAGFLPIMSPALQGVTAATIGVSDKLLSPVAENAIPSIGASSLERALFAPSPQPAPTPRSLTEKDLVDQARARALGAGR